MNSPEYKKEVISTLTSRLYMFWICIQANQVVLFLDACLTYNEVHGRLPVQADSLSQ